MLRISRAQFDTLSDAWKASQVAMLTERLRKEMADSLSAIPDDQLEKQVRAAYEASENLGTGDIDIVYWFVRLFFMPASVWQRPGARELLVQVLKDTASPLEQRLVFIENRILAAVPLPGR